MLAYVLLAVAGLIALQIVKYTISWRRNLAEAKASGIPYIVVPLYVFSLPVILFHGQIVGALRKLPKSWTSPWLEVISPMHSWYHLYSTFKDIGSDTYLTVSPAGNMLWTASPDVISQITTRRGDFPKPVKMYKNIDIFGKNVVSSESQYWRHHRKIVSPPFTEKNNHLVWTESIHQAGAMMKSWTGMDGNESKPVRSAPEDTMMLSLHVISRAGFGQRLLWPGVEDLDVDKSGKAAEHDTGTNKRAGHQMTYTEALSTLLENLILVVAGGKLLEYLPSENAKRAYLSFVEWRKYMTDMLQDKKAEVNSGAPQSGLDLMGAMIRSAGGDGKDSKPLLTDEEILGNAFVFILAGHETTANSIHYSLIYHACNPSSQRRLQADLESIFQGRPPSEWSYDRDLPKLFGGMVGATMSEQLRLIPPVIEIPKSTLAVQPLMVNGKRCTVPANTLVNLSTAAAHRNPNAWPHGKPRDPQKPVHPVSNLDNDLEEFKPERWLLSADARAQVQAQEKPTATHAGDGSEDDDATGGPTADTAAALYKPVKGSYLPFSDGARSCLGKRFAQVEVLAVLAVIFSEWSVELALDDFATEEEVQKMSAAELRECWEKARDRALLVFREKMASRITLKMEGHVHTPLRFVRKGKERFSGF